MPVLSFSTYSAPRGFRNGHLQTVFPAVFRRTPWITRQRVRITTPDGDFLDLDQARSPGSRRTAVLSHGLEGASGNAYVQGMALALLRRGWNIVAWNFRGCSGEPNRVLRSYHSGATEDLSAVVDHVLAAGAVDQLALVGFSLGGNLTLKYLGESPRDPRITRAAVFSVPCDLASSSRKLESLTNRIYMARFLQGLRKKIREKMVQFPGQIDGTGLERMRTFREFDGAYTAPLNGFRSAEDYWERASSRPVLGGIRTPTLLVNASDDPFLAPECYPVDAAENHPHLFLEMPDHGGHIGFVTLRGGGEYWSEWRAAAFLETPDATAFFSVAECPPGDHLREKTTP